MKLPANFPNVKGPYFILALPVWLQHFFIGIILIFQLFTDFLLYHSIVVKPAPLWVIGILVCLSFGMLFILLQNRAWERWVSFVATHDGCYFRQNYSKFEKFKVQKIDRFIFVPWKDIGDVYIGERSDGDGVYKSVIMKIKVSKEEWERQFSQEEFLPKWVEFFKTKTDENGYREYLLGNQFQNLEKTKTEILKFR